ncbi:Pepsin B [Vulpes lagopus]
MYWQVAIDEFLFGNQATGLCSQGCQGIMDTGTFPLTIPRQYLDSFVKTSKIKVAFFVVNCNSIQSMPTITFVISGSPLPLPPSIYVLNEWLKNNGYGTVGIEVTNLPSPMGSPCGFWDMSSSGNITVYDMAVNRIG